MEKEAVILVAIDNSQQAEDAFRCKSFPWYYFV